MTNYYDIQSSQRIFFFRANPILMLQVPSPPPPPLFPGGGGGGGGAIGMKATVWKNVYKLNYTFETISSGEFLISGAFVRLKYIFSRINFQFTSPSPMVVFRICPLLPKKSLLFKFWFIIFNLHSSWFSTLYYDTLKS